MCLRKLLKSKCRTSLANPCRLKAGFFALGGLTAIFFAGELLAQSAPDEVDVHQLHLPRTYLRYLPPMLDGARLMAADEHCAQFLAGDLNIDQSTLSHPVFRYQCRDPDGMTYRWHVDGDSLEVIDETRPGGRVSFAELSAEYEREREQARQRAAERQAKIDALQRERQEVAEQLEAERLAREQLEAERQEQARRGRLWQTCTAQLAAQTADMIAREWLTVAQPEPEVDEGRVRFNIDFNARNLTGTELKYRAYCDAIDQGETVTIEIHPRALVSSSADSMSSQAASTGTLSSQSSSH